MLIASRIGRAGAIYSVEQRHLLKRGLVHINTQFRDPGFGALAVKFLQLRFYPLISAASVALPASPPEACG